MSKTPLLVTGLHGLVGSKLALEFSDDYQFDSLDISDPARPIDITNYDQVAAALAASPARHLVHFAAFTDVNKAWDQRDDKSAAAWQVNVVGTENIVRACQDNGIYLIHISTAYVFDGSKPGLYLETDKPNPIEWYGRTKFESEERVLKSNSPAVILRIDQPFRSDPFPRLDTAHRIIAGLTNDNLYPQFTDHYFGPTFIDDFVRVIDWAIRTQPTGIFHATSGEQWSDYDFALQIKKSFNLKTEVKPGSVQTYLQSLARPYQLNTALDISRLTKALDFKMRSVATAIDLIDRV